MNPQNFDFESNTYANSVSPPCHVCFIVERSHVPRTSHETFFLYPPIASDYHVHDRVRVLAEVVGFEPTTYAGVKVLCLEPYLATPLYGADSKNRTYNCPLGEGCYVHLTIPAYGAKEGTRTPTAYMPADFKSAVSSNSTTMAYCTPSPHNVLSFIH